MKTGIALIAQERAEQLSKHNRSVEYDSEINCNEELSDVARILLLNTPRMEGDKFTFNEVKISIPKNWDLEVLEHMFNKSYKERVVIAAALLAAELDRLTYLEIEDNENESKS